MAYLFLRASGSCSSISMSAAMVRERVFELVHEDEHVVHAVEVRGRLQRIVDPGELLLDGRDGPKVVPVGLPGHRAASVRASISRTWGSAGSAIDTGVIITLPGGPNHVGLDVAAKEMEQDHSIEAFALWKRLAE